ncbi:MAG: zinc ribbon domain-containing protein [Clostridia bacterium]|nr:zinc ribbon domain-containing protein [Clostridia bacterium]
MENKCPHCGKPLPKASSFCMYCMHAIHEKDIAPKPRKKRKRSVMIALISLLIIILSGSLAFVLIRNKPVKTETSVRVSTTAVTTVTQSATQTTTAKKNTAKKETTTKKKKAAKNETTTAPTEAATVTQPQPQTTQAPATRAATTASNAVSINGGTLSDYPNTKQDSFYAIPYGVSTIATGAFHGNKYLQTLKFSKRANLNCNWSNLFANLPNLSTIYIYAGTSADTQGMQYFDGEIIYYYD